MWNRSIDPTRTVVAASWLLVLALLITRQAGGAELPAVLQDELTQLYRAWSQVYYEWPVEERAAGMRPLAEQAEKLRTLYPDRPEVYIMEGVVLSGWAEKTGKLESLKLAKRARERLEESIEMNPEALNGAAWVTLGALYARLPGWPVGFGDADKARDCLQKALSLDPENVDAYFFYGEYLAMQDKPEAARAVWQQGLVAPVREAFPIADAGRRRMIREAIAELDR